MLRPIFAFAAARARSAATQARIRPCFSTAASEPIYEVRAYHHNENWNAETKAEYCSLIKEIILPALGDRVTAFYVKADDDAATRDKRSAAQIFADEHPEDDGTGFPSVVWVARYDSMEDRDETFGGLLGSEAGQKFVTENPFSHDPPMLQGYEKIEEHYFRQPLGNILPNCIDTSPNAGKIHEVRTYYFPLDEYLSGHGMRYGEWAKPFFTALAADPLFKDKVRVLYTRGFGDNVIDSRMTSGSHALDPDNNEPPPAEALQPGITWACQWDSVEQKDEAWAHFFSESGYLAKYFGEASGHPFSETGQMEGYKKMRIQFMESLV